MGGGAKGTDYGIDADNEEVFYGQASLIYKLTTGLADQDQRRLRASIATTPAASTASVIPAPSWR